MDPISSVNRCSFPINNTSQDVRENIDSFDFYPESSEWILNEHSVQEKNTAEQTISDSNPSEESCFDDVDSDYITSVRDKRVDEIAM
jgi:hypothetical protein